MERELRKKFVIVTMSLMCLLFGVFFAANHYRQQYWFDRDTLQFVRWITQSGILLNESSDDPGRELIENASEYNAVVAVLVSENGDIIEKDYIAGTRNANVPERIIRRILSSSEDEWKVDDYIYDVYRLPDSQQLIVMIDTRDTSNTPLRIISSVFMIILGIFTLLMITIYLSRFVTNPAKAAMQREKQFISDASHELKTPLGAISINAQALASSDKENKHINNIISESERMSRLIERLLILSRLDENASVSKTALSLSSCVEEMALTYESVAYDKGITYDYDIAENVTLYGNDDDIRQLMAILTDNAIKNTEPSGSIHISLSTKNGLITLKVENTGKGISPDDIPHIFERFYKADSSRSESSFGLGLAIAKAVTERNNGIISVQSETGNKTCFTVTFK